MKDLEKAARQALEALESYTPGDYSTGHVIHPSCDEDAVIKAITALHRALEQPAQIDPSAGTQVGKVWWDGEKLMAQPIPLKSIYKEPEQPAQEHVIDCPRCGHCCPQS